MFIIPFPRLRQNYDYDCGASALHSVLAYYGIEERWDKIVKLAKTNEKGTSVKNILSALKKYGLKTASKRMKIEDVKKYIDKKIPVILIVQAWTAKKKIDWETNWDDGHYVVAIGYSGVKIIFQDPSSLNRTYLTLKELEKRWHDVDENGKKYINHGIAVFGKKPAYDPKEIVHMN